MEGGREGRNRSEREIGRGEEGGEGDIGGEGVCERVRENGKEEEEEEEELAGRDWERTVGEG